MLFFGYVPFDRLRERVGQAQGTGFLLAEGFFNITFSIIRGIVDFFGFMCDTANRGYCANCGDLCPFFRRR